MNENVYKRLMGYNKSIKEIDDTYRNVARIFGLPECTFWILYTLRVGKSPLTQSEICSLQYKPKQTVNSALKKMESDGYISLSYGDDQRSKYISLTEKGIRLAEKTVDKVAEAEAQALSGMPVDEQEKLVEILGKFSDYLRIEILSLGDNRDITLRK